MWSVHRKQISNFNGLHYGVEFNAKPASFGDVLEAWRNDSDFRAWFNDLLATSPFEAFRWETPSVTNANSARPFEFVVLDSPDLERRPDRDAFAEHFERAGGDTVVAFANLGGDAILVAPHPIAAKRCYGHLASFVREAPDEQRDALWALVGTTMANRISAKPVWLSTAGAGVAWLHVRLDNRPKYYGYTPYRASDRG